MLYLERVKRAVMATNLESSVAHLSATNQIHVGNESFDAYEVLVLVLVLQVLTWYLHIIELLESEFAKMGTERLQSYWRRTPVKPFLEPVPPFLESLDVLVHGRLVL